MTDAAADVIPTFIDGPAGRLFLCHFPPAIPMPSPMGVVIVPPFAEEMNRARPMMSRAARALAEIGCGTVLLDLYGTGDSEGELSQATWEIWRGDVRAASDWLHGRGLERQAFLGVRLGANLALDSVRELADRIEAVVLWAPVLRGAAMLTQFLRVRIAANMAGGGRETTAALRARLAAGETVEIAGYPLPGALAQAIDGLSLAATSASSPIVWLDVSTDGTVSDAAMRVTDGWRAAGRTVRTQTVAGAPFWALQETALVPELLAATRDAMADNAR